MAWALLTRRRARGRGCRGEYQSGMLPVSPTFVGGFGSAHNRDGANFAFGDGSVRFVKANIDQAVYQHLGHRSDGELIDGESY